MTGWRQPLADEEATAAWAAHLAASLPPSLMVALEGDLGAGKTTLVRALLRSLGYQGVVPSPTYTLLESYELPDRRIHHLDLYRLADPEELEFIGLRDLLAEDAVVFVEWPSQGGGVLPAMDLTLSLAGADQARRLTVEPSSAAGQAVCDALRAASPQ